MGMGSDCSTDGCPRLWGHPGECAPGVPSPGYVHRDLKPDSASCPTRNCRRTEPHDAKGCVVAWEPDIGRGRVHVHGPLPDAYPVLGFVLPASGEPEIADRAFFMPPRFKS